MESFNRDVLSLVEKFYSGDKVTHICHSVHIDNINDTSRKHNWFTINISHHGMHISINHERYPVDLYLFIGKLDMELRTLSELYQAIKTSSDEIMCYTFGPYCYLYEPIFNSFNIN